MVYSFEPLGVSSAWDVHGMHPGPTVLLHVAFLLRKLGSPGPIVIGIPTCFSGLQGFVLICQLPFRRLHKLETTCYLFLSMVSLLCITTRLSGVRVVFNNHNLDFISVFQIADNDVDKLSLLNVESLQRNCRFLIY